MPGFAATPSMFGTPPRQTQHTPAGNTATPQGVPVIYTHAYSTFTYVFACTLMHTGFLSLPTTRIACAQMVYPYPPYPFTFGFHPSPKQ